MARQLLPEDSRRKSLFLTYRKNFVDKNDQKVLKLIIHIGSYEKTHWWTSIHAEVARQLHPEGPWRKSRFPLH